MFNPASHAPSRTSAFVALPAHACTPLLLLLLMLPIGCLA